MCTLSVKLMLRYNKNMKNKYLLRTAISLLGAIILFVLVVNNSWMYKSPVAKVVEVHNHGNTQVIEVRLENGRDKGKLLHIINKYDKSKAYDEQYYKHDYVFLNDEYSGITGVKRDYWVAAVFLVLLASLIVIGGKKGTYTSLCVLGNIALFGLIIYMNIRGFDILHMTVAGVVVFTFFVLLVSDGISHRMMISFAATLLTTLLLSALIMLLIWNTDIDYDFLHFLPEPFTKTDANHFFLAQIIIGCLGAIIDVSVTITAASMELVERTPDIGLKALLSSVRKVADDINGTMISVVLLTNIAYTLPIFLISMSNEISFRTVISHDVYFYIVRSLSGMLSIIVAILVSLFVTSLVTRKELKHD